MPRMAATASAPAVRASAARAAASTPPIAMRWGRPARAASSAARAAVRAAGPSGGPRPAFDGVGQTGPSDDQVGAVGGGRAGAGGVVPRAADHEAVAGERPRLGDREAALGQVDAVGVGGERDVDAIVHEQQRAARARDVDRGPGQRQERAALEVLLADLDQRGPGRQLGERAVERRGEAGLAAHQPPVGHQHQPHAGERALRRHRRYSISPTTGDDALA